VVHAQEEKIRVEAKDAEPEESNDYNDRDEPYLCPDNEEGNDTKKDSLDVRPTSCLNGIHSRESLSKFFDKLESPMKSHFMMRLSYTQYEMNLVVGSFEIFATR
jgi:hypothetical protein